MNACIFKKLRAGYTLLEVMVATAVFASIGGMVYNFFSAGSVLYAKNVSVNFSNSLLRNSLDRVNFELSQATDIPELITANGDGSISTTTTAAAGIRFDKYVGGPYVMTGTGTISSTSYNMTRSTNALVTAPIPTTNDVVLIDAPTPPTRGRVNTCTAGSVSSGLQSLAITLQTGSTAGVGWVSGDLKTATLIHKVAFLVVGNQLRFYPNMEGVTVYNSSPSNYTVISTDIGTNTSLAEDKPFSLVTKNGKVYVSISMRVQNRDYNVVLAKKESREFNTSLRIDTLIRPRNAQ